ncbi:MAG: transcription elongation factor GreA [Clostridia bacterium]|nr:transcription elongation factor GreA [Clostridia bacterium]
MAKEMLYTEEGYKSLVDELDYLKTTRRPEVKEQLAIARSYGDLSENSEYDEAKNEQAKVEARIAELEELIIHAKVIKDTDVASDTVNLGSVVKVKNLKLGVEKQYHIVGSNQTDALNGKISDQSPIGAALIGAKKGDTVTVHSPAGEMALEILSVERA